jgi:hypothetical protein
MVLLLAGMGSYVHAGNDCKSLVSETILSPTNPTESELQLLKRASPILEITYSTLVDMFQHGEATIEQNEDANWVVSAYMSGGGVLIAILNDTI